MRARLRLPLVMPLAAGLAVGACNLVTGVTDLQVSDGVTPFEPDAASRDGAIDQRSSPGNEGGASPDATVDAGFDGGDGGCTASPPPTFLLGVASPLQGFTQLTQETNGLAGGLASASAVPIDDFDASFTYSITFSNGTTPGAGLAFFVLAASSKDLPCQPGPNLCTLGGTAPGFAVILRTSKVNASDPNVPYVAVVDAQTFPGTQPTSTVLVDPTKVYTQVVAGQPGTLPAQTTFHLMSISVRSGKVSASIDALPVLTGVPIPNWVAGRMSTWGVSSATGQGASFAERTVVGLVTLKRCP